MLHICDLLPLLAYSSHLRTCAFGLLLLTLYSCGSYAQVVDSGELDTTHLTRPNILWITCEDISPTLSMYGDSTATTPNLDALAAQSVIYDRAFATVGVCAPARSSIITGMYPTSIGTMHMRAARDINGWGRREYRGDRSARDIDGEVVPEYAAVLPPEVKCFTEYLRDIGYYCVNNAKTDYQFAAPQSAWDENGAGAHWRNTPEGTPFFAVFNYNQTHESKLWKYSDKPLTVQEDVVSVPPYLPDIPSIRQTVARHYSNIELLDRQVGKLIAQLKADKLYDDTIIFFFSDHGGPLPRQKREAYDSGLRVPLMVKPAGSSEMVRSTDLVSFVDLAPTVLSMAGLEAPAYLQGYDFIGRDGGGQRNYVYGSADRFDDVTDRVRVIRTKEYLYVKNFHAGYLGYKEVPYRRQIPGMGDFLDLQESDRLDPIQSRWFEPKQTEELYFVEDDPHNIYDLAENPRYVAVLMHHRNMLDKHLEVYGDLAILPESLMVSEMWPEGVQPTTAPPIIKQVGERYAASCETAGSSISYLIAKENEAAPTNDAPWQLYAAPVMVSSDSVLYMKATRIGYKASEVLEVK